MLGLSATSPFPPPPLPLPQPLEVLNPLLQQPGWAGGGRPLWVEVLIKLKPLLMSIYFGADHIVWLQQVRRAGSAWCVRERRTRAPRCLPLQALVVACVLRQSARARRPPAALCRPSW